MWLCSEVRAPVSCSAQPAYYHSYPLFPSLYIIPLFLGITSQSKIPAHKQSAFGRTQAKTPGEGQQET